MRDWYGVSVERMLAPRSTPPPPPARLKPSPNSVQILPRIKTRLPQQRDHARKQEIRQRHEAAKRIYPPHLRFHLPLPAPLLTLTQEIIPPTTPFNKQFLDLLKRIFVYDPSKRITALDALKHPWFREVVQDEGTEAAQLRAQREEDQARSRAYRESDAEAY